MGAVATWIFRFGVNDLNQINDLDILIKSYLASAFTLISDESLNAPIIETCVKYFILGAIVFTAQLKNIFDEDFYFLVESVFGEVYENIKKDPAQKRRDSFYRLKKRFRKTNY